MSTLFGKPKSQVIRHPGALTRAAKKAHETNHEYEEKHKNSPGKAGKRARLALTMASWNK